MATDEERREVAQHIRDWLALPWDERPYHIGDNFQQLGTFLGASAGENIFKLVADLIDRPTCHMELVCASGGGMGDFYRCSACLNCFAVHGAYDNDWRYCPNCGAEVVR